MIALARDVARGPHAVRSGLGWGLLAGVAFFTPLLYWIAHVEAIALPLLVLTQASSVAVYVAGLALLGRRARGAGHGGVPRGWSLAAVVLWVALEALRSTAPWGGFPWGVLGYTQHDGGLLLPLARTAGVLGVSAACAAVAAAVEAGGHRVLGLRPWRTTPTRTRVAAVGMPLGAVLAVVATAVLAGGEAPPSTGRAVDVAAVQGNDIVDTRSLTRSRVVEVADRMVTLTKRVAASPEGLPDVVVWPENSLDADVTADARPELRRLVLDALEALDGTPLLAGMLRTEDGREYNTMALLDDQGTAVDVVDIYAKRSLVPFGEFVPLREHLGWVRALERAGDFSAGDDPGVFSIHGAEIATVICFENNFPELTRDQVREGAELVIVSTNNASFGDSPASSQHIAFSQLRAVESGRWVVHAGISGASAVISPSGDVRQRTGLFEQAIVRDELPLVSNETAFTRTGDIIGPAAMLLAAGGCLWAAGRRLLG